MKIKFDTKNSQNNVHNYKLKSIKICDIFSDGPSFEAFMQHLAREFNVEICLCFVEMIQYKFALKERFDIIKPDEITTELIWEYNSNRGLLKVAPLSIINRQGFEQDLLKYKLNDDSLDLVNCAKKVCLKLYEKYIGEGGELEVNISYEHRFALKTLMSDESFFMTLNISSNELFCLYDDIIHTMLVLMNSAFMRFKQKPQFENLHVCQALTRTVNDENEMKDELDDYQTEDIFHNADILSELIFSEHAIERINNSNNN